MKSLKAAAVVAGSLAVVGAGAPAFASEGLVPTEVTQTATDTLGSQQLLADAPVSTNALDPKSAGSVVGAVDGATDGMKSGGGNSPMIGGLPVGG
ncbi:hypothetical protein HUT18_14540 [Streptomyces sp. NA04227]|nr:hypothetical protein [Streptomyces sp. NA04227]QKW10889.1 hypothetical protein HUT18_14540 [Streptomyces sp. NA04227]